MKLTRENARKIAEGDVIEITWYDGSKDLGVVYENDPIQGMLCNRQNWSRFGLGPMTFNGTLDVEILSEHPPVRKFGHWGFDFVEKHRVGFFSSASWYKIKKK